MKKSIEKFDSQLSTISDMILNKIGINIENYMNEKK